jgi:hypothetical protein
MSAEIPAKHSSEFAVWTALRFLREHGIVFILISALLLIPCFWHRHIQAGDLGSHVYNAWLAQLIEHHQLSGLVIAQQWNNVLFDILLLHAGNLFGWIAAERIVVSLAVLVFFWGSFSFVSAISRRSAWLLAPLLLVLAYGYVFHMGFFNFYLSLGLAWFVIAIALHGGAGNWLVAILLAALTLLAHPIGFLLGITVTAYILVWKKLGSKWRIALPVLAGILWLLLRLFFAAYDAFEAGWRTSGFLQVLGQDQLNLFGRRYLVLSCVALAWGFWCALGAVYDWIFRGKVAADSVRLCSELYLVALIATVCLPENLRTSVYAGWIGLLVSRLTLVTAIFGVALLGSLRLPRWSSYGFIIVALVFFAFTYQDTGKLDAMEASARAAMEKLPVGTRVVAVANPPDGWRIEFIHHSIERACIGHCFSYANYEPSSQQFRVRALPGSYVVASSAEESESMSSGDYIVQKCDLPLTSIYQCDEADFTALCAMPLRAGQKTEDPEADPAGSPISETPPANPQPKSKN